MVTRDNVKLLIVDDDQIYRRLVQKSFATLEA